MAPFPPERQVAAAHRFESESGQALRESFAVAWVLRAAPALSAQRPVSAQVARVLPEQRLADVPRSRAQARVALASALELLQLAWEEPQPEVSPPVREALVPAACGLPSLQRLSLPFPLWP
jgi:hypothetical protein